MSKQSLVTFFRHRGVGRGYGAGRGLDAGVGLGVELGAGVCTSNEPMSSLSFTTRSNPGPR
jgi:hypothetical protein